MALLGGALATGCAAAYLANEYIDTSIAAQRSALDAQYERVRVVVANTDLRAGALLSSQAVAVREMPRAFLHSEAVRADRWSDIAGRILAHGVRSGEPVLRSHLTLDASAGFSAQLGAGMRALTFPVNEESSIAGMLAPGDHIDVFFTTTAGSETVTLPLLVDVPVIATGIRTMANAAFVSDRQQPYRTVTVAVTPEDSARITLAQDAGKITITLRQPEDQDRIQVARITKSTLLNAGGKGRRASSRTKVEIILGNT